MDTGVLSAVISAIGAIGVAVVGIFQYKAKKASEQRKQEIDERDALRHEGALIQMEMSQASLKLAQVTAKAVTNQKTNGDVEEAMNWAKKVEIKLNEYLRRTCQTV